MPRCKKCNKFGLFLKLDYFGLCEPCQSIIRHEQELYIKKMIDNSCLTVDNIPNFEIKLSEVKANKQSIYELEEIKISNITKKTSSINLNDFVVLDIETTGLSASRNKILQLSAIKYEGLEPIQKFNTYINPNLKISEKITKINGISDETVRFSPQIEYVISSFNDFVGKSNIVGHNIRFDLKFLYANGWNFLNTKRKIFDTCELSKKAFKDSYSFSLKNLCDDLRIYYKPHNSIYDCYATAELFKEIIREICID